MPRILKRGFKKSFSAPSRRAGIRKRSDFPGKNAPKRSKPCHDGNRGVNSHILSLKSRLALARLEFLSSRLSEADLSGLKGSRAPRAGCSVRLCDPGFSFAALLGVCAAFEFSVHGGTSRRTNR